ncbi:aspartate/glutamate racemase family protein [Kineosporia babensis]|uniref:Uncharacterized protein n=1 Tax=Kineosporia babensis TaxID=499548 RepID=A0A9X1NL82_9ACTN|nr:hypothetical protein [Kineosporia babensis]MCD5317012.1 hypothetical protein [Kineosporia babensis]
MRIGLLGGTNWSETLRYYRLAKGYLNRQGDGTRLLVEWVDDHEFEFLQVTVDWDAACLLLQERAEAMQQAEAAVIVLCGSLHPQVCDRLMRAVEVPMVCLREAASVEDVTGALRQAQSLAQAAQRRVKPAVLSQG